MPRYIDLDKQLVRLYRLNLTCEDVIKEFLLSAEAADVPERKVGKWITEYDSWGGLFKTVRGHKCSLCNHYLDFDGVNAGRGDANYCPNCGARMGEEDG